MDIVVLIGVIFVILNVWILVEYHSRLTDLHEDLKQAKSAEEHTNRNVFSIREDMWKMEKKRVSFEDELRLERGSTRAQLAQIAEKLEVLTSTSAPEMPEELIPDVSDLSQNELERLARKREFDQRIEAMREELGYNTYGTHAEEVVPEVKNLPHNIIPVSLYDLPDVEIAE